MTLQTVELAQLQAHAGNPRKTINQQTLEGLADSIKTDGLLQNLVVKPIKGKGKAECKHYRIVSGERRYRALKILVGRGDITNDFSVPVEIRNDLTKDDTLPIAAIENLQRENLPQMDEAVVLAKLIHKGVTLNDLVAKTGLSASTIKRRCALNSLSGEGEKRLRNGEISLAQAEALSLGSENQQEEILKHLANGYEYDPDEIRDGIIGGLPSVAMAVFPLSDYTGAFTTDLFGEAESTYLEDEEQFMELQRGGVDALADYYREGAAWVEVTENYSLNAWQFEDAEEGQPSGVLINFSPHGEVEIKEGLVRPEAIDPDTADQTADTPANKKAKPAYSKPLCQYIAYHKTIGVQAALLSNPRKAKEVAVARLLVSGKTHEALSALAESINPQSGFETIDAQARIFAGKLGIDVAPEEAGYTALVYGFSFNGISAFEAVQQLTDDELEELHLFISILPFGQESCAVLDTGDTLFNRVAQSIEVDMRKRWQPDTDFLNRRNRKQCLAIAMECGYADVNSLLGGLKKSELVNGLLKHFYHARQAVEPTAAQQKALDWLPSAMQFPSSTPEIETPV